MKNLSRALFSASILAACGGSTNTTDGGTDASVDVANDAPVDAAPSCVSPKKTCGTLCTDVQTDHDNCGTCGNACSDTQVCSAGACTIACAPLTACIPDAGAPYCANIQTDSANCGACGNVCPLGEVCVSAKCTPTPVGCGTTDPNWSNVVAYVACSGTTIADASGKSTLATFNTPTISSTPSGAPGGASCSLGNGGSYGTANGFSVTLPSALGSGDFTVELAVYQTAWYDPTDQNANILVSSSAYPPALGLFPAFFSNSGAHLSVVPGMGSVYVDQGSTLNAWESYALSRVSGTDYVFRGGALLTSFADTTSYTDTKFYVGLQMNGTYNAMMGSVGQVRVTKGVGRYTTAYTPCAGNYATQ